MTEPYWESPAYQRAAKRWECLIPVSMVIGIVAFSAWAAYLIANGG